MSLATRFIGSVKARPGAISGRVSVPWLTVIPLAIVMAYADGFWMISLRGAFGAIERTQDPFGSWVRESTLTLPIFVFAVLGAITLALRWFGPVLSRGRTLAATASMIVVAGTLVGIGETAASSAYDYRLQSELLQMMTSMRTMCAQGDCLASQQHASLMLQARAVGVGSAILLVTNAVLVAWAMAFRGGRLEVSSSRRRPARSSPQAGSLAAAVMPRAGWLRRSLALPLPLPRAPASAHARWLTATGAATVIAIGLAGNGLAWFDHPARPADHHPVTSFSQPEQAEP